MQHATAGEIAQNGSTILHNTPMYFVLLKKSAIYKFGIDTTFLSSKPHPRLFFALYAIYGTAMLYRNSRRTQSPAIHNPKTKWTLYTGLQVYEAIILIIWPYPHVALTSPSPSSDWKKPYVAHQTVTVKMNTLCSNIWKMCNVFSLTGSGLRKIDSKKRRLLK